MKNSTVKNTKLHDVSTSQHFSNRGPSSLKLLQMGSWNGTCHHLRKIVCWASISMVSKQKLCKLGPAKAAHLSVGGIKCPNETTESRIAYQINKPV